MLTGLVGCLVQWQCWLSMLSVGTVQTSGVSPLYIASQNGHVEVVRALLGAGADVGQAMVSRACSVVGGGGPWSSEASD